MGTASPDKLTLHESKIDLSQYYSCTCPHCGTPAKTIALSSTEKNRLERAFNKVVRWAYNQKKTEITPDDLDNKNVQGLTSEINKVLQEALKAGINYQIPEAMLQHFNKNIYVFSGAKTYAELRQLSNLLVDDKGEIKPFSKFFKEVRQVHNQYNKNYLATEYDFALQSAQMASKWSEFEQDGDEYNLQYRTANDSHVRYEHQLLHNTTLPPSDPFWSKFFPPNGWRCRCNVIQVRKNRYPLSDNITANDLGNKATYTVGSGGINTSEMFRFNPGKQKIIFPKSHPYFDILSNKDLKKLKKQTKQNEKETWIDISTTKGKIRLSSKHGKNEKEENVEIAKYLAEKYEYKIDLLANEEDKKTPDSFNKTLNIYQEYKRNLTASKNSIDNAIRDGAKQANNIVLDIKSNISEGDLKMGIQSRVNRTKSIQKVTIIRDGDDKTYTREQIIKEDWML